ncbi:MAG: hypothetical protein JOZ46_07080 [Candidatus Dormibacteraeota bacterium]|nr:hypothetical protein [Candidatus Dormibacteraeota bacterium]MBV9525560.1 hypothetical protein [Candidatus Dormibacteraeota bacterium]
MSYTANTLTDTSKSWTANQWANATVVAGGTTQATVASNTSNTLTLTANWSSQPANGTAYTISFFKELTDCAWDVTQGGSAATANYASQQNSATFNSSGQLGISLTVNQNDAICDRVELKGTTSSGTPFADYSNLVGSPSGTNCTLPANTPEAPSAALIGLIGTGGALGAILWARRRRNDGGTAAPAAS